MDVAREMTVAQPGDGADAEDDAAHRPSVGQAEMSVQRHPVLRDTAKPSVPKASPGGIDPVDTPTIVLEYLKVFLSGPVVTGGVVVGLALVFRVQLRTLIGRIAHIRLPGGGELSTTQQEKLEEAIASPRTLPPLSDSETRVNLPEVSSLDAAEVERIQQLVRSERGNAILWEYRYLNFYLARATQVVLDWLAARPPLSLRQFDAELMTIAENPNERAAIFTALQNHHLIAVNGDLIEVTPKGSQYLAWRGPLMAAKIHGSTSTPTGKG